MRYFAKYQPNAGFKFALDGVHNYSKSEPLVGIYCLNPPAVYYGGDAEGLKANEVNWNSELNW